MQDQCGVGREECGVYAPIVGIGFKQLLSKNRRGGSREGRGTCVGSQAPKPSTTHSRHFLRRCWHEEQGERIMGQCGARLPHAHAPPPRPCVDACIMNSRPSLPLPLPLTPSPASRCIVKNKANEMSASATRTPAPLRPPTLPYLCRCWHSEQGIKSKPSPLLSSVPCAGAGIKNKAVKEGCLRSVRRCWHQEYALPLPPLLSSSYRCWHQEQGERDVGQCHAQPHQRCARVQGPAVTHVSTRRGAKCEERERCGRCGEAIRLGVRPGILINAVPEY